MASTMADGSEQPGREAKRQSTDGRGGIAYESGEPSNWRPSENKWRNGDRATSPKLSNSWTAQLKLDGMLRVVRQSTKEDRQEDSMEIDDGRRSDTTQPTINRRSRLVEDSSMNGGQQWPPKPQTKCPTEHFYPPRNTITDRSEEINRRRDVDDGRRGRRQSTSTEDSFDFNVEGRATSASETTPLCRRDGTSRVRSGNSKGGITGGRSAEPRPSRTKQKLLDNLGRAGDRPGEARYREMNSLA
eukprot:scaffold29782_cov53-Cyclotella_meneghiniana.AAC.4